MPAPHEEPAGTNRGVPPPARASSLSASVARLVVLPSQQQEQPWAVGTSAASELHVGPNHLQALSEDTREGLVSSRRHDLPGLTCAAVMLYSERILLPYPKRWPTRICPPQL